MFVIRDLHKVMVSEMLTEGEKQEVELPSFHSSKTAGNLLAEKKYLEFLSVIVMEVISSHNRKCSSASN